MEGTLGASERDGKFALARPAVIHSPLVEMSYLSGWSFDDNYEIAPPARRDTQESGKAINASSGKNRRRNRLRHDPLHA
jgi:hypothetical protein